MWLFTLSKYSAESTSTPSSACRSSSARIDCFSGWIASWYRALESVYGGLIRQVNSWILNDSKLKITYRGGSFKACNKCKQRLKCVVIRAASRSHLPATKKRIHWATISFSESCLRIEPSAVLDFLSTSRCSSTKKKLNIWVNYFCKHKYHCRPLLSVCRSSSPGVHLRR